MTKTLVGPAAQTAQKTKGKQKKSITRTKCEIWTRVMGYHRPISQFNRGKKSEYKDRVSFSGELASSEK